eukprot:TRINITY_DN11742_c0_g1_i1.p1 TRINITY_DN11742_c0_g1~~TRINITY_DN11742_c0_g1_i1.p1  ORF type:complete len:517 (+),score=20.04 TRINITY_DN11742_c0_g1_i1:584-2134(+)
MTDSWTLVVNEIDTFTETTSNRLYRPKTGVWQSNDGRKCRVEVFRACPEVDAIIYGIEFNTTVHSLKLQGWYGIDPHIARHLNRCYALKSLTLMGSICSGEVFRVLQHNTVLKSLVVEARHVKYQELYYINSLSGETCNGEVLEMLKYNTSLVSLKSRFKRSSLRVGECWPALNSEGVFLNKSGTFDPCKLLYEAFEHNTTLRDLKFAHLRVDQEVHRALQRNRSLPRQWYALLCLARPACARFGSLRAMAFRKYVFDFFLPPKSRMCAWGTSAAGGSSTRSQDLQESLSAIPLDDHTDAKPIDEPLMRQEADEKTFEDSEDPELDHVKDLSMVEACEREAEDLSEALLRSKVDAPWNTEILRLTITRHAKAREVEKALCYSPALAECRQLVEEDGCDLRPAWANGAWLLLPVTLEQYSEAGFDLSAHHILVHSSYEQAVRLALQDVPRKQRPRVRPDIPGPSALLEKPLEEAEDCGINDSSGTAFTRTEILVERTFVHFPSRAGDGKSACHSAPF